MSYDIGVCSMFRDSQTWHGHEINQVDKFFENIYGQAGADGYTGAFFLVEGNSRDDTYEALRQKQQASMPGHVRIYKNDIEGSEVASLESQARFKNLSACGNTVLRAARDAGCKYIFWMESDLIPPPTLLSSLLEWTQSTEWESTLGIAPVPVFKVGGVPHLYDTWALRDMDGSRWVNAQLDKFKDYPHQLRVLSSFGSCALLNGDAMRKYNLDFGEGCFPELCRQGREAGLNLYCDLSQEIHHPCSQLVNSRLI